MPLWFPTQYTLKKHSQIIVCDHECKFYHHHETIVSYVFNIGLKLFFWNSADLSNLNFEKKKINQNKNKEKTLFSLAIQIPNQICHSILPTSPESFCHTYLLALDFSSSTFITGINALITIGRAIKIQSLTTMHLQFWICNFSHII